MGFAHGNGAIEQTREKADDHGHLHTVAEAKRRVANDVHYSQLQNTGILMRVRIRAGFLPIRSASMPHMIPPKVWPIKKMAVMMAVYVVMTLSSS